MKRNNYPLHISLFLLTVFTTMLAGAELVSAKSWFFNSPENSLGWKDLQLGASYAFAFLLFLTVHEFGHYFTAVYHRVKCSLPYYIPIFIPIFPVNIGSMGAVIRIRQVPDSRRKFFDIGVAGPLAGFVVSVLLLIIGFATLPDMESYIYQIHPWYAEAGHVLSADEVMQVAPGALLYEVGTNGLFEFLKWAIPSDAAQVPPPHEMMHYPFLFAGFLTLFFTAMNLLPIGQLDGGHVIYGLFGARVAGVVSRVTVILLLVAGGTGVVHFDAYDPVSFGGEWFYWIYEIGTLGIYLIFLAFIFRRLFSDMPRFRVWTIATGLFLLQAGIKYLVPELPSYGLWLLYAFLAVRMIGVDHPVTGNEEPLTRGRKILGWLAIIIFLLCFTPFPLVIAV